MGEESEKPITIVEDVSVQARLRENIRTQTSAATNDAVNGTIEAEKESVRSNEQGGFWGFLKSIIFKIAEFLGAEGWLAGMMGVPIPEKQEVGTLSKQVGDTVSRTLTDPDFEYENRKDFETQLASNIYDDLKAKKEADEKSMDSFSLDQLKEVAQRTAKGVGEKFSGLFDKQGNKIPGSSLSAVAALANNKFTDALSELKPEEKEGLGALAGKDKIDNADLGIISSVLATDLAELESRKGALKAKGGEAYHEVADQLSRKLIANKDRINQSGNMNFTDAGLTALADKVAEKYVSEQVGVGDVPESFQERSADNRKVAIKETVRGKLSDALDKIQPEDIKKQIDKGIEETIESEYPTDPDKHSGNMIARNWKAAVNWAFVGDTTATLVGEAPSDKDREKLAEFMSSNAKNVIRDEIESAFDRRDRSLDIERIQDRLEKEVRDGIKDGSIPKSWKVQEDKVVQMARSGVAAELSANQAELDKALSAAAGDAPSMPRINIPGVSQDKAFDAPNGTAPGSASQTPSEPGAVVQR